MIKIPSPLDNVHDGDGIVFTFRWNQRSRCCGNPVHDEAAYAGARQRLACHELGLTERTLQRWQDATGTVRTDARPSAVRPVPANKLSEHERAQVLRVVNETRFASLPPTQIVPTLADEGRYVASESTMYRILREEKQLEHRGAARAPVKRPVPQHCAQAPNQLWCWDISVPQPSGVGDERCS